MRKIYLIFNSAHIFSEIILWSIDIKSTKSLFLTKICYYAIKVSIKILKFISNYSANIYNNRYNLIKTLTNPRIKKKPIGHHMKISTWPVSF